MEEEKQVGEDGFNQMQQNFQNLNLEPQNLQNAKAEEEEEFSDEEKNEEEEEKERVEEEGINNNDEEEINNNSNNNNNNDNNNNSNNNNNINETNDTTNTADYTNYVKVKKVTPTSEEKKKSKLPNPDPRPHLNVVFIGHVDAGKSTTCGNILYLSGQVDERTIEKYEKEAKDKNRESWFFAFIMDINEEERAKGKTVEVGRAQFTTANRRFTILDAPGHKSFVPNMISGAAQADVGVLIISARKGEFETGFERGGQTREHALLAKTLGVNNLIVAVNKMDDYTCDWDQFRYEDIVKKLTPYLKTCGYNPNKDITFVPISGLTGQNLLNHVSDSSKSKTYDSRASWYSREMPTLFDILDKLNPPERKDDDPIRVPLLEGYKENGTMAVGKIEAGTVRNGSKCVLMPNKIPVKVLGVFFEEEEVAFAKPGENVRLKLLGVEEEQISRGSILCSENSLCSIVTEFEARIAIVELLEHRPVLSAGYGCIFHAHTVSEEIQFSKLIDATDKKTKKRKVNPRFVKSDCMVTCQMQLVSPVCLEEFETMAQLGRFTLRDEGKTIAIGKVTKILATV